MSKRNTNPLVVEIGQRSETVRRANLRAIVQELHRRGPQSRSTLVARTGLTRSAIRGLVGELVAGGLALEKPGSARGLPGRPSPRVSLEPSGAVALALEIAVDSLAVARVGLGGEVLDLIRIERTPGHTTVDEMVADLARLVGHVHSRHRDADPEVGIGVAVVGVVRRSDGLVSMAPNLGWVDVPLGERLAAALGRSIPISIANDADLGAIAELRRGAAIGADHVLFLQGEVGVGAGLIVDGVLLTGVAGYAGEVGHMPMNPLGVDCRCGSVGCWETEVGSGALLRRAGRDPAGGPLEVDALLREAEVRNPRAVAALDETGAWLGRGLAGLVNILDPRLIVLGGLLGRIHPYTHAVVERELDRLALRAPRRLVRVVPAALGQDAPLLGAAELGFEALLGDPAVWLRRDGALTARVSA